MNAMPRRVGRKRKGVRVTLPGYEAPTAENIRQAEALGMEIVVETYHTDAGETTQLRRQRVVSPLEQLWKAGAIDAAQFGAARCYQQVADMAAVAGPGAVVRYEPRMIQGGTPPFLLPIEAMADHLAAMARAQDACGAMFRPMLSWIAAEAVGWREQARAWWPDASERGMRAEFLRRLRITCNRLRRHYSGRA